MAGLWGVIVFISKILRRDWVAKGGGEEEVPDFKGHICKLVQLPSLVTKQLK